MNLTKVPPALLTELEEFRNVLNRVPTPEQIVISDMTRIIPGLFRLLCPQFIPLLIQKSRAFIASWKFRM